MYYTPEENAVRNLPEVVNEDPIFDTKGAAKYISREPHTLANDRSLGKGPVYLKIGRLIRYRKSALDAYLDACIIQPGVSA